MPSSASTLSKRRARCVVAFCARRWRLTERARGPLVFELPHPRADGATHLLLDPMGLIEKLTLLIPPPRFPGRSEAEAEGPPAAVGSPRESASRWAALLRRVFALDLFACPRCGGRRRLVGVHPGASRGGPRGGDRDSTRRPSYGLLPRASRSTRNGCASGWASGARCPVSTPELNVASAGESPTRQGKPGASATSKSGPGHRAAHSAQATNSAHQRSQSEQSHPSSRSSSRISGSNTATR